MSAAFLVIDKPPGVTSHDIVAAVRAVTGIKKVGHTGTLDPFATGVLPLALDRATRLIRFLDESLKVYDATIKLGESTSTGDPEGEVTRTAPVPDLSDVDAVLASFVGPRMQTPPAYSAVKVDGRPLYKYARAGETREVPARPIEIFDMKRLGATQDTLRVEIHCTRGTYARVLADEIAEALDSAGHLSALRRLRSGPFTLEGALTLPELARMVADTDDWQRAFFFKGPRAERLPWKPRAQVLAALQPYLTPVSQALGHLPRAALRPGQRHRFLSGGTPPPPPAGGIHGPWLVVDGDEILALVEKADSGLRTFRVA
ncbi:MAG: tRNA pseudouridine(55) synthase TruB [Alphaproteobacteria bacterium]|nr:tRNA pseudouridine(55) synthase TruB [Alphaproteobacteria bacterium]